MRPGRPAEIGKRGGGQHRVGHDLQSAAGVDMDSPPVHLDDSSAGCGCFQPIIDPKGLFEQHEQARHDLADGVLQHQADDD